MDESDADQILTVEELRALRDRVGAEAAAGRQARNAAQTQTPVQTETSRAPEAIPLEDPAQAGQALPEQARHRQYGPPRRWPRRWAAVGCLAVAGGLVTVLVISAQSRPEPRSAGGVSVPVVAPPVVSFPVVSAPTATTSSAPWSAPEPVAPTSQVPVVPPVASAVAPDAVADHTTTSRPATTVQTPRRTYRPTPSPTSTVAPSDGRPPPTVVNLDQPPPGAGANRAGVPSGGPPPPCGAACPGRTVNQTPTSWSPAPPQ